jgi:hypothetical protein
VKLRRLRSGELVALAGSLCIVAFLALPSYHAPTGELGAFRTFGAGAALLMLAALFGLGLALATVTERTPAIPVATAVWSTLFGLAALIAAIVRLLERPGGASSPATGGWLALAGALALVAGSWQSMRDERLSLYLPAEPSERRPAPPAA